jgi:hypothetical protein
MALVAVRMEVCRFGWQREIDDGSEHLGSPNYDAM